MELKINEYGQELKHHGTFGFPVKADRKWISSYATGSFPWHWHNELELTLVLSGAMEYRINETDFLLRAGDGLFCNTDALHTGHRCSEAEDCEYISVTVHPRFLYGYEGSVLRTKYVLPLCENAALASVLLRGSIPWQQDILQSIESIYQLLCDKPELYELTVQQHFLSILSGLCGHCGAEEQPAPPQDAEKLQRLRALLVYLHAHYQEKLTLDEIAGEINLSKSECCRFFKKQMGLSIFDYLLDYRVERSLQLLRSGKSVGETAAETGFSSPAYFAKVFRLHTGRTPSEYRREQ